jgi:nicotinamide-nucleotide amidase
MEFETKVLSRQIQEALYHNQETLGTAESCTGGRIAEAVIAVPGASNYFKGGVIAYTNEVKEEMLGVSRQLLEEQTAVCEEVAKQMVAGACRALHCTYAISATGIAGPTGGTKDNPVGTIWIACGSQDDIRAYKLSEDFGRDINLTIATNKALNLFLDYLREKHPADPTLKSQFY